MIRVEVLQPEIITVEVNPAVVGLSRDPHEIYTGPYQVDPRFTEQVLATEDKIMTDDVTVRPIEVSRTSNPYGTTVYIGGTING